MALCVTYNSASTIRQMITSLADQNGSLDKLVIVDNGSVDNTVELVKSARKSAPFEIVIVLGENVGFARGINRAGEEAASSDSPMLVINPDVELHRGVLAKMLEVLHSSPQTAVVTAPLIGSDGSPDSASIRTLPSLGGSALYSVLGRLTPGRLRYNSREAASSASPVAGGHKAIEATTGALMLIRQEFRKGGSKIFDEDYWMYGEDLQLCHDVKERGQLLMMINAPDSLHHKGVSSGWPRGARSNRAFHDAMFRYYKKNLSAGPFVDSLVYVAVNARLGLSLASGKAATVSRRSRKRMFHPSSS